MSNAGSPTMLRTSGSKVRAREEDALSMAQSKYFGTTNMTQKTANAIEYATLKGKFQSLEVECFEATMN